MHQSNSGQLTQCTQDNLYNSRNKQIRKKNITQLEFQRKSKCSKQINATSQHNNYHIQTSLDVLQLMQLVHCTMCNTTYLTGLAATKTNGEMMQVVNLMHLMKLIQLIHLMFFGFVGFCRNQNSCLSGTFLDHLLQVPLLSLIQLNPHQPSLNLL